MCNRKTLEYTMDDILVSEGAEEELKNLISDSSIIDKTIDTVLKDKSYSIIKLKEKKDEFVNSITNENGHIKWMIEDLKDIGNVSFSQYDEYSLGDQYRRAYCLFYKELSKDSYIMGLHPEIKEILIDYFYSFEEMYCT